MFNGPDSIVGSPGDDSIRAFAGNDHIDAGPGNDVLDGGAGIDSAVYAGSSGQYALVNYLDILRVVDKQANRDGVDQLIDVEQLHFDGDNSTKAVTGLNQFTPLEYIASHADLMAGFAANAALGYDHFVTSGRFEGREVPFDGLEYIASYANLIQGFGANADLGAQHFIHSGRFEGRFEHFDAAQYLANYADLQAAFNGNLELATIHYIQSGYFEGRT